MKMQVPLGKPEPWVLPVTFVCLALGALIATMVRISATTEDQYGRNTRPEDMVRQLLIDKNKLDKENMQLRQEHEDYIDYQVSGQKKQEVIARELDSLRIRAGTTAVEGRGIVISIDDSNLNKSGLSDLNDSIALTHDVDLLMLVNELRAAGAEAIAVNDQRIVFSTAIRCVGPVIYVNNRQISAPFILKAIGKTDVLVGAMNLPYGVLDQLKQLGIKIEVAKRDKIYLPPVGTLPSFEESKVVKEKPQE